ncbi:clotting factor B-like [Uloborus diversus]|uniref:clotting factor B-like n=1 Tax=Uloborus diversus TaxID=327109 RepID=UPI00240A4C4E|nr:clotting factor B-like [Uloborus diversus]
MSLREDSHDEMTVEEMIATEHKQQEDIIQWGRPSLYYTRIGYIYHANGTQYDIVRIVRHDGYRKNSYYDDIAMLTLDRDVQFPRFNPVCLPDDEIVTLDLVLYGTTVAGWGATRTGGNMSPVLTLAERLQTIPNENCTMVIRDRIRRSRFQEQFPNGVSFGFLCTGLQGGSDSCNV